jgi:ParB-like chromosome segregation protein Spo0J
VGKTRYSTGKTHETVGQNDALKVERMTEQTAPAPGTKAVETPEAPASPKVAAKVGKTVPAVSNPKAETGDKPPAKGKAKASTVPATTKPDATPDYDNYQIHPAADLLPMMSAKEFAGLVEDIRENGQLDPVYVIGNQIVDGRNRYRAAKLAGLKPKVRPAPLDLNAEGATISGWVVSKNLQRRNLTTGQKAIVAAKLADAKAEEIKAREAARKANQPRGADGKLIDTGAAKPTTDDRHDREATAKAGAEVGVSGRAVARAKRVIKEAPDLAAKVESGEISLNEAESAVKGPETPVTKADNLIRTLWTVVREVKDDPQVLEAFDWALSEDQTLRESLVELLKIKS